MTEELPSLQARARVRRSALRTSDSQARADGRADVVATHRVDGKTGEITNIENIARDFAARHGRKGCRPRLAEETSRIGLRHPRDSATAPGGGPQHGVSESELAREAIDDCLTGGPDAGRTLRMLGARNEEYITSCPRRGRAGASSPGR